MYPVCNPLGYIIRWICMHVHTHKHRGRASTHHDTQTTKYTSTHTHTNTHTHTHTHTRAGKVFTLKVDIFQLRFHLQGKVNSSRRQGTRPNQSVGRLVGQSVQGEIVTVEYTTCFQTTSSQIPLRPRLSKLGKTIMDVLMRKSTQGCEGCPLQPVIKWSIP